MLRCPPSRISLTNTDIIDFEATCNARQSARLYVRQRADVRLSPGPGRHTASAITTREENDGRQRAASASSQATVCSAAEDERSVSMSATYVSCQSGGHSDVPDLGEDLESIRKQDVQATELLVGRVLSPKKAGKQPDRVSHFNAASHGTPSQRDRTGELVREYTDARLDGVIDSRPALHSSNRPARSNGKFPARPGLPILGEIESDAYPSSHKPLPQLPPTPPALSSARARRRYTRSHEIDLHQQATPSMELNPVAPAFVPQTRLARDDRSSSSISIVMRALEPRWNSLDSTHSSSSLRIRSSSEQNIDHEPSYRAEHSCQSLTHKSTGRLLESTSRQDLTYSAGQQDVSADRDIGSSVAHRSRHSRPLPPIPARRRLSSEHSNLSLRPSSHLERYPVLRPPIRPQVSHRQRSSRVQTRPPTPSAKRVQSMVSAASGISSSLISRRASAEGLDASAEFLRMRGSPLDDLTERISRVAASRQRSVGRSWERPPVSRHRISLLNGDIFRQDAVPVPAISQATVVVEPSRPIVRAAVVAIPHSDSADEVAFVPPASPPRQSTSPLPRTPLDASTESSTCSPLAQKSPSKAAGASSSAVKRKPLPAESMTPRIPVYDDSKPLGTQSRTPADIPLAIRSRRELSDTMTAVSPPTVLGSPPSVPGRHTDRPLHPAGTTPRPRRPQAQAASRASYEENDLDEQISRHPELEEDRLTWFSRQEDGSLESTPPKEGRFEQYLS